ncbi:SEC-C metal-binding domain-containing protein [Flavobacterium hydatis]|uniref:SEC-C domain-containing protein n=1 Tax=Flavobacterium hydatis TaxID=991 RepID=A0A086A461_FLAHY|nr:SEC-C metal-binding domain-containing protein [Flavobacterium hydatis]KFF11475.1 hypothetical protein IW20_19510 [Flavobacterium hydatis]OXA93677.1 hypothetical protein B0A62_13075 [Flavobacterium hydatis]
MKKINRNDPCHCGSKIKYKKCCYLKDTSGKTAAKVLPLHPFFGRYNSFDLLNSIAALSIMPENHGKNVRFEELTLMALQNFNTNAETVPYEILNNYVSENFPDHSFEEIPVNLFTDSITFHNGNNVVFPGITENGTFVLSNLLTALFIWPDSNIADQVKENSFQVTKLLLNLSNTIAKKNGFLRYEQGTADDNAIFFPPTEKLQTIKDSLILSRGEMETVLSENDIDKRALDAFLIDLSSDNFDHTQEENPLIYKPLLSFQDQYLIISPTTISFALAHYIWWLSDYFRNICKVSGAYHDLLWNSLQQQLTRMHFDYMDDAEIPVGTILPEKSGLYRFDDDKIAFIQYVFDDGTNYKQQPNFANSLTSINISTKEKIIGEILADSRYSTYKILDLVLISPIGRGFAYSERAINHVVSLNIPLFEFNVLSNLKDCDALDLWKFALTNYANRERFTFISFSVLDKFKLYRDRNESFHSDIPEFGFPVPVGFSQELYKQSILKIDNHAVRQNINGRKAFVIVEKAEVHTPIYLSPASLYTSLLQFYIEGYPQGIWVMPASELNGLSRELRHMYWEFNGAFAYWLWQICSSLSVHLKNLDAESPLTVSYIFDNEASFETIDRNYERQEGLADKFKYTASLSEVSITIPTELLPYLYGSDNQGERVLVETLLKGFNLLLLNNGQTEIKSEEIAYIIEKDVPLGMKKKIFILDTSDNLLLDPSNLQPFRHIQKYDIGLVLDQIVPRLASDCPSPGELVTKEEKNKLTNNIIQKALLPLLREKLALYDSTILLQRLLGLNESLIRKREFLRIHTPTIIACYVSVEEHCENLMLDLGRNNRSTIAVRSLIEHIAAEPYKGTNMVSVAAIDELMGIMDQIVDWGSIGDQIHYELFDIRMGVLETGRIASDKNRLKEVYDPYNQAKISENVQDAVETFADVFPQLKEESGRGIPENLNRAFLGDFGVSMERILVFMGALAEIAFQLSTPYGSFKLTKLRSEVNKYITDNFDPKEFDSVVSYLALTKRGKLEKLPKGYDFIDIMPWRFNRMLSLLRKPLIIVEDGKEKIAYWGPRAILDSRSYLMDQCTSDRLRVFEDSKIKSALGKFAQERGDALVKRVVHAIDLKDHLYTDVYIGPKHDLKNETLIGDIDVMIIDQSKKVLYSLECKSMSPSRNIKEMIEEVDKLFGSDNTLGWIGKHMRRHEWLENNKDIVSKKYGIDISSYSIKSIFVTQENMLTPHLKKDSLPLPFITIYDIEKDGLLALENAEI